MDKAKVQALAANVNSLIGNYQNQQRNTAKLFKACLDYLEGVYYTDADIQREGGVFKAQKAAMIKRSARKKELIAAIKGYIKMINEREAE